MPNPKVATKIIDKNGVTTTRHKNVEKVVAPHTVPTRPATNYNNLRSPEGNTNVTGYVGYEYDYYGCTGDHENEEFFDGICRDSEYENLRVDTPDVLGSLVTIFRSSYNQIPQDLIDFGYQIGMDDPENYEVRAVRGYYGDEAQVDLAPHIVTELTRWYYRLDEAKDNAGILKYVRARRTPTAGLNPLEAIKKQLEKENGNTKNEYVEKARYATAAKLNVKEIHVPNQKRLDSVDAEALVKVTKDAICGVVFKRGEGDYVLVDGYHRYKTIKENSRRVGKYIILS